MSQEINMEGSQSDEKRSRELIKKYTYIHPKTQKGWLFLILILIGLVALFPGLYFANRIYPTVLGAPFSFAWFTFWSQYIVIVGIVAAKKLW